MDDEELSDSTERWVEADLIDAETATAIREFERSRADESTSDRVTSIVAIMGALLIGVGIVTALAAGWDDLAPTTRTVILLAAPILAATGGIEFDRRGLARAGLGLWILAALIWGPVLFLLADIHVPTLDAEWLFLAWGVLALPMGHAFATRIGTAVGLGAFVIAIVLADPAQTGPFAAAAIGCVVLAATLPLRSGFPELLETYRVVGMVPVIAALLWVTTLQGEFVHVDVELTGYLVGSYVLGVLAAGVAWVWPERDRVEGGTVTIPLVGAVLSVVLVQFGDGLPGVVALVLSQGLLLATLLAIVGVAVVLGSRWLVNLVAVGFLLQVLSLLVTFTDELSGSLALIVVGAVLLLVAIGLERGRRRLIDRIPGLE